MYRVYKSQKVTIGTPKSIINKMDNLPLDEPQVDEIDKSDHSPKKKQYETIIEEAHEMYANIIEEANKEAKRIMEEKYNEIEIFKKKELEKAYEQGFRKGYDEARKKTEKIIDEAINIRQNLEKRKESIYKDAEEDIVELILSISKKIIGDEIQQNKNAIISQIKLALEKCTYKSKVTVKVSSEDYPNVLVNKGVIESLVEGISELEILEDKFLKKGDCIIDTPSGEVNSSIELQIEQLQRAFYFVLRNEW
ncbi:MAG: hypothetical protein GX201_12315 [Clostridiales bacterium]|nr:hypothetical protein [Clostridiales bacterium]